MKKWFLLWGISLLCCRSFGVSYLANFDAVGTIEIMDNKSGLRIDISLQQIEPHYRYMIKLLSDCKRMSPYWTQFRHSFEFSTVSDKSGVILHSTFIPGMQGRDLRARNLNTVALYKLEKSQWKMLKCMALQDFQKDNTQDPVQP